MKRRDAAASRKLLDLWQPPAGAGDPVAMLATSFTFDEEFFETECLARFAAIEGRPGEGSPQRDLEYLIELEGRLAEIDVSVLVDRSSSGEGHSLRFDVLPVGVRGGLLHAKTALLVWRGWVRWIVGSANLTPAGYRSQIEAMTCFDAGTGSEVPRALFDESLSALREIVALAPPDPPGGGPRLRAERVLDAARRELDGIDLRESWPERLKTRVVLSRPGRSALTALDEVWSGGPAREAWVVSPYFDTDAETARPLEALVERLAKRGDREISFALPVDEVHSKTVVLAPSALARSAPDGVGLTFHQLRPQEEDRDRRLHAKGILLFGRDWTAALIGSSNFTVAGLGLDRARGHVELDIAFGAPRESESANELENWLRPTFGDEFDPELVAWEPADDEESAVPLPWGFLRALLDPGPPPLVRLALDPTALPSRWSIETPDQVLVLDASELERRGRPAELDLALPEGSNVLALIVRWDDAGTWRTQGWPLNVTDRAKLPPREELRDLSAEEILAVLAATRPLHEALAITILSRGLAKAAAGLGIELDPLKRYSSSGHLFARTREFSRALAGLRRHLSRPAPTLDSLRWRLESAPWSPRFLARALLEDAGKPTALQGEAAFRLAELARTLSSIDWKPLIDGLDHREARALIDRTLDEIRATAVPEFDDPRLTAYVREALQGSAK